MKGENVYEAHLNLKAPPAHAHILLSIAVRQKRVEEEILTRSAKTMFAPSHRFWRGKACFWLHYSPNNHITEIMRLHYSLLFQ